MRILFAFLTALLVSGAVLAGQSRGRSAGSAGHPGRSSRADDETARLDKLFSDLKRERNEKAAERIAGNIWSEWFQSGSASIDLMMLWSQKAMDKQKFDVALDFLDQVVTLAAELCRGLEPSRHRAFHDEELRQVDVRHRPHAAARAAPFRCAVGSGADHGADRPQTDRRSKPGRRCWPSIR